MPSGKLVYGSFTTTSGPAAVNLNLGFLPDEFRAYCADDTTGDLEMLLYLATAAAGAGWKETIIADSGTTGSKSMDYVSSSFITAYNPGNTNAPAIWKPSTAYNVGDVVIARAPLSAPLTLAFQCTTAGTSGSTEPVWPTAVAGVSPSDNGTYWTAIAYGGSSTSFTPTAAVSGPQGVSIPAGILKASVTYHYVAARQTLN